MNRSMRIIPFLIFFLYAGPMFAEQNSRQQAFFEEHIRPVLVENCYECHSIDSEELKAELLLDSKWGWQQGGESGPVIIPGNAAESPLLSALRYEDFEMPPKGKLSKDIIAKFAKWIEMGAPDPREKRIPNAPKEEVFDLDERRSWWSLKPVSRPRVPVIKLSEWPRNDYDRFVLSKIEERGWKPAGAATKNSWLRRVTYDLTGLPPTPAESANFTEDNSPGAYRKVVDRLLDSKHFGEQWARHWMDLVRYAETKAFEADYAMPNVYQYRDYLIRAFNDDVPYNQLLMEAVAGDLIPPRLNPESGVNESVIGPGYLYLTDGQHGPPDVHLDEARIFDDMIDVLGKAFLGQTIACARCHDHKFDAITTKDYYSLYGIIASSRIDYADINPPIQMVTHRKRLEIQKAKVRSLLIEAFAKEAERLETDLADIINGKNDSERQKKWAEALQKKSTNTTRALSELLAAKDGEMINSVWQKLKKEGTLNLQSESRNLGGLSRDSFGEWKASGIDFGAKPRPLGDFTIASEGEFVLGAFVGGRPAAGHLGSRFAGSLKSPTFLIEGDTVRVRAKGKNVRVSLYVRHYELIGRGPTTGGTTKVLNSGKWETISFNTKLWVGEPAYIEIQHNGGEMKFDWATGKHVDGSFALLDSAVVNQPLPPLPSAMQQWAIQGEAPSTRKSLMRHLSEQVHAAVTAWKQGEITLAQNDLLQGLHEAGALSVKVGDSPVLNAAVAEYRSLQSSIPRPTYVRTLCDGTGADEPDYIRGSHRNQSDEPNPRHFLAGIDATPFQTNGSGRLEWAKHLTDENNPLTARLIVNRIWHHLFGRGIVPSVDDFGHMGDVPSNPELLDFLADQFVKNDWSIKTLIRELVLSSTYRMSSEASRESLELDPGNATLQHMPMRRLQAEAIRDTLLAVTGQLDKKLYGPSIRGDGGNRRSLYTQLRRRFMPDFLMTFDMPNATEPFGRRNVTSGPAQSLEFMNGKITWQAAESWARRIASKKELTFEDRIDLMHREAFARKATAKELDWAEAFRTDLCGERGKLSLDQWKEICHTMLNRKELIYVY